MSERLNNIIKFITLIVLLVTFSLSVEARPRDIAYIGKVNLKAMILLHPSMASYDPYKEAFRLSGKQASPQQVQQKLKENQTRISELENKANFLRGKIEETHRNFDRQLQKLSDSYLSNLSEVATGQAGLQRQQYKLDSHRSETTFNAKLQSLGGQLMKVEEEIDKLNKVAYHPGYTNPEETNKRFYAIISEIKQYTHQIATKKGIQVVLNSNTVSKPSSSNKDMVMPAELDYGKIFALRFPNEIRNDAGAISGYYSNISSLAYNWLVHGEKVLNPFQASLINTDIFIGGVDLTNEVMTSIFRAYKIDQNLSNAILQSINSFNR